MTKAEIRSLIKNHLPKIDKTNKYHPEVIDATIERAFNTALNKIFAKNPAELDNYTKEYTNGGAGITVAADATSGINYSTLPVEYVPLPDRASGVRHVYTKATGGYGFYPMSGTEFDLISRGVLAANVTNKIGYVVKQSRVEYYDIDATTKAAGVRMEIVPLFREYADTDTVNLPFGSDLDLVKAVLELMGVIPPTDLQDSNSEQKVEQQTQ